MCESTYMHDRTVGNRTLVITFIELVRHVITGPFYSFKVGPLPRATSFLQRCYDSWPEPIPESVFKHFLTLCLCDSNSDSNLCLI